MDEKEISWKMNKISDNLKLNTKEFCFLCLQLPQSNGENENFYELISLANLRHHLKIKINEHKINSCQPIEVEANLCEFCAKLVKRFSALFQQLEKIQMELDYNLGKISERISTSNSELFQTYSKVMTSDVDTLSQLPFIDALRKEISAKCTKIRSGPSQSVELLKTEVDDRPIPVFVKIELPEERPEVHVPPPLEVLKYQDRILNPPSKRKRLIKKDPLTGKIHCLVPTCKKEFIELSKARYHFDRVHSNKTFNKCPICHVKVYKCSSSLWAHKRICRKQQEKKIAENKSRKGFQFRCPTCRKKFATNSHRAVHHRRCHSRNGKFSCDICNKTFSYSDTLNEHKNAIHFKNVKKCKHCKKEFIHSRSHRRHEKNCLQSKRKRSEGKFKQNSTKMFICPSCPKVFKSLYSVQIHFDSIHLQNKYPCDICKVKVFSHKVTLKRHQERCSNTLQKRLDREQQRMGFKYQCNICENRFKHPSKLLSHKTQVHFNERKFPCGACDKVFKRQDHLDRHKSKTNCNQSTNENVLIIKLEGEEVI